MPKKVELNTIINRDKREVYALFKKLDTFPLFIKNIKKIDITERHPNRIITAWEVNIDGAVVIWKEEDVFDDFNTTIDFCMLKGDFKEYKGRWVITGHKNMSRIHLAANFDWGIPVFERFVGNILLRKAKVYLKGMLKAIKKKIESEK